MQFWLNFLFPKPHYSPQSRLFIERYEYTESQICLSKLLIESEEPKLDENQKIGECRKNCVTRSYADNLLKFCMQFCTPSKVKYKRSKPQGFFCWQFFFAATSFSLNNNICLFVCLFFSECCQIILWSLLDQKHLQFQEMTYQCRFSMYCNKEKTIFFLFFFLLLYFLKYLSGINPCFQYYL